MSNDRKKQGQKKKEPVKNNPPKKAAVSISFTDFVFYNRTNLLFLMAGVLISVIYAVALEHYLPRPSFFFDSGTYIQAARDNAVVSFRPLGYSDFIRFFHDISASSAFFVVSQYICNMVANLFLFFTLLYFFPINKWYRLLLFVVLTCNPLYILYSNYILSEAFFCSFSVAWFAVLLWMIKRPSWLTFIVQLLLLTLLFKLRYNAIMYPFFVAVALYLSDQAVWKKLLGVVVSFFVIFAIVQNISNKTEKETNTRVFSAFGGWQMASNALNVIKHITIDPSSFTPGESQELAYNSKNYFDSLIKVTPDSVKNKWEELDGSFLWDPHAPLKQYIPIYGKRKNIPMYFARWTALGPVFSHFGTEVASKYPLQYIRYFVWPNTKLYWNPKLEAYEHYNEGRDSVNKENREYYHYPDSKVDVSHAYINNDVMKAWKYLFPVINILFLVLTVIYFALRRYEQTDTFFTVALLFTLAFYISNFLFSVFLAPTVFRYHVTIITLCLTFSIYLLQFLLPGKKKTVTPVD